MLVLVYKALNVLGPKYLKECHPQYYPFRNGGRGRVGSAVPAAAQLVVAGPSRWWLPASLIINIHEAFTNIPAHPGIGWLKYTIHGNLEIISCGGM